MTARIVDGADDDWASRYAHWLINLSELPEILGVKPVRSELIYLLVGPTGRIASSTKRHDLADRQTRRQSRSVFAHR